LEAFNLGNKKFSVACLSSSELWQQRLGHLPFDQLKNVVLPSYINPSHGVCQVCPQAKLHRQPFHWSITRATHCFDMLHIDIWGPCTYKSYDGAVYF